ncbi:hypothetical protein V5799_013272, partial [Amblyomma americanum]
MTRSARRSQKSEATKRGPPVRRYNKLAQGLRSDISGSFILAMSRVSAFDPERVRLLILEEYYLLEKKKIVFAMYPDSVCGEDVDTPALPGSFERGNHRLLLLEEYFLLEKKKLLEDMQAPRRWWVRPLWKNRSTESEFYTAMPLLISGDPDYFRKYYRMTPDRFEQLHALVEGPLTKGYLTREPLPSRMRLAITLRYLASGMHMQEVALAFRVGISTVAGIIHFTCRLLWKVLQPLCLKMPTTERWQEIANGFHQKWNFPHCVGAVDGKHVQIQAPPNSGSRYYNYKGTYSIVRCVESAFGVMASRFRIFRRVINLKPENVDFVVLASCALHNFLTEDECYMDAL